MLVASVEDAGLVVDHDLLAQRCAERLGQDTRDRIGGRSWREANQQPDRLAGILLR
jgi:hypothetical protein